uniref:Cerebellin 5 n=1 Tax=Sinocyclocheilus rhinocerous TaxID=307959 RepID=A0A673J959_9TELE
NEHGTIHLLILFVHVFVASEKLKNMEERIQKLEETLTKVMCENAALKSAVIDSQNKLESLQKENEAKKVAFSAGLLPFGIGHTGRVFSNFGSAYDSNTGVFTAPMNGVYYFRFYAHCHSGTKMAVSLLKNGQTQCSVFSWKPVTSGNASNGIVLTLESGDQTSTELWPNTWVYDDKNSYTSFSGFLIFPL